MSRVHSRCAQALVFSAALATLPGCGSDTVQGPQQQEQETEEPIVLDFSAIQGAWSGWGTAGGTDIWLVLELDASAEQGRQVGTSSVGVAESDGDLVETCAGNLRARTAQPPDYTAGTHYVNQPEYCTGGLLELEHDPEAGTLTAEFTAEDNSFTGTHVLRPGSDPGPEPSVASAAHYPPQ